MPITIEKIHTDLIDLKKDMDFLKHILSENYELSEYAKKELMSARKTPSSEYVDLE